MNWTADIVRARFVEAADTEARLPRALQQSNKSTYWPGYLHSFEEMAGWGEKRLAEERQMRLTRTPPSAAAISRHEEVTAWLSYRIAEEKTRDLVWFYVVCRVAGRSFSAWCRRRGIGRVGAYQKINRQFESIARQLCNDGVLLQLPDDAFLLQEGANSGSDCATLAANEPDAAPTSMILPGGLASDLLKSDADLKRFARHLKRVNRARRKVQERRQRAATGRRKPV